LPIRSLFSRKDGNFQGTSFRGEKHIETFFSPWLLSGPAEEDAEQPSPLGRLTHKRVVGKEPRALHQGGSRIRATKKTNSRLISLLALVFFFSGFAALIYQVVWQRLLTVHYGVGSVSITLIISVYMFGLGVGALFGGFLAERARNRIIWFFAVQFLLGLFGLISLPLLDLLGRHTAGSSYLVSFFYMFLFLCLPTFVMGITLPLLTKIFNHWIRDFLYSVSYLYFINTLGAAIGAVFASYAIISFFGLDIGIYFASAVNFVLAAVVLIAMYSPAGPPAPQPAAASGKKTEASLGRIAYLLVLITGFLAIGYEIVWFRVVGVLVKASPYAFSSVLCVYLLGVALGSLGMTKYLRRQRAISRKNLFFLLQFIISST